MDDIDTNQTISEQKDEHQVGVVEANTSINGPRWKFPTSGRQALADSMMKSVNASISKLRHGDPPTIYIVPQSIRQVNEVAYEPQIVSIGPYHNGKERLQRMEEHKWLFLHSVLSRNPNHQLEDYLEAMEELEEQARSCYSENVGGPQMGDEFVKMMVLDGCFLVGLFIKLIEGEEDPIFSRIEILPLIAYDMLLLENQIPFFVLQRIFKMASPVDKQPPHLFAVAALAFFDQIMPRNEEIQIKDSYHHLLHLFHSHLIPTPTHSKEPDLSSNSTTQSVLNKLKNLLMPINNNPSRVSIKMIPCAAELQLAGVKFKKKEEWNSILDVKFSHGVMEIPPLLIYDHTNALFRNLVAFEQCCVKTTRYFTAYFWFMDCLVNTSKDVALLHHNEILDHGLGSDEDVAQLFNRLCTGILHTFKESYLSDVQQNVQKHCKIKGNMWRASLIRDYFTNPWSVISLIAASILIVVTITQTFFTVLPYYQPRS